MVKVRMNTADVAAEVKCLRLLIGMRCSNVYDLSPKTYVFKLMSSSGQTESGESEKKLLLMESGVRLHTTEYMRDKSNTPSGFTLKLRKHIRTRRLEDVRQLGYDRIILFQFGLGVNTHYVILELYAQGNIILTDSEYTVLTLLRSHRDDDKGIAIMSRHRYPVELSRVFERTTKDKMLTALKASLEGNKDDDLNNNEHGNDSSTAQTGKHGNQKNTKPTEPNKSGNSRTKQATLKVVLGEALGYGPALSEHIILDAGLIPSTKVSTDFKLDDSTLQVLAEAVTRFEDWLADVISGEKVPEGYILMQQKTSGKKKDVVNEKGTLDKIYDEFGPLLLNQFKSRDSIEFETFDAALDEFYSKIESQRVEQQQKSKENSAMQKLDKIKHDQESRVHALKREVEQSVKMAELIEYNLEDVDAAILAVRAALANGMSWVDLGRMVKDEKKSGNPVAGLIDKLYLERSCITLLLSNNLDEMDDDEKTLPADKVEVDLALSAHANARRYYEMKKKQESKQEKTITAHEKAFKAAEKKTRKQLSQEKTVASISHMRKVHWFEKFNWFISSENYLIISGRDAQQNEMIVKRYMSKGDLYVHAELHGASSTVIKNHKPEIPVPPLTINQAGCFTVCHSQAWDSKIVTSAWWVYPHQVSKTAPTGEYLTVGSFMIRGKKNFLPPHPLVMGFGMLFRLDESSLGSHLNERRVRGEEEMINDAGEDEPFKEILDSGSDSEKGGVMDENSMSAPLVISSNVLNISDTAAINTGGFSEKTSSLNNNGSEKVLNISDTAAINTDGFSEKTSSLNNNGSEKISPASGQTSVHSSEKVSSLNYNGSEKLFPASGKTLVADKTLEDLLDRALELGSSSSSVKYGLHVSDDETVEEPEYKTTKAVQREKPYVSKAERRKLKKGQKDDDGGLHGEEGKKAEEKEFVSVGRTDVSKSLKPSTGKISRGQKAKLKKIKEKYADQDEEERSIRMALLAAAGKSKKEVSKSETETATAKIVAKPIPAPTDASKVCYKCKKLGHTSRDCPEHPDEVVPSKDREAVDEMDRVTMEEDDIHEIGDEEKEKLNDVDYLTGNPLPNEMDRVTMEEDDIHEIGDEEKEKLNDVDYLTGNPLPNDVLLYVVPVCGPYNSLQSYKYRVKIIPGSLKKGKAAKTAMNLFSHMAESTTREKELMKACTDPELVAAIIGNSKVSAAGLSQLKQKQKKSKKAASKGVNS